MTKIQLRRDTATNWRTNNPTPASGEPCFETDTGKLKIGDGTTAYNDLAYQGGGRADSYTKSETDALLSEKNDNIFDIGKFTIVGGYNIPNNGIVDTASMSASSYVELKDIKIGIFKDKSWEITNRILDPFARSEIGGWVSPTFSQYNSRGGLRSNFINGNIQIFIVGKYGDRTSSTGEDVSSSTFALGNDFSFLDVKLKFDIKTGTYTSYYKKDGIGNWQLANTYTPTTDNKQFYDINVNPNSSLHIAYSRTPNSQPSMDIKYYTIVIDGKEVFNGLMNSTKPIYDKITSTNTELSNFKAETSNDFSAVNSALNEKANLSDLGLKQNLLVSGTNIKTINGETILGEGNITVGGGTPTNAVTTDTDQTITGKKVFLQPNSANKGLDVALGSNATNPDASVHIGRASNSDFTGGMIRFDSTAPKIVGLQQSNSGGTMKISSSGDLVNYAAGKTEIRNGATWSTSKSGIRIPANSESNPKIEIVGGTNTVGSSAGVDAKVSIGHEGGGSWAQRKGVFIETRATTNASDSGAKLWLGERNIRSAIYPVTNSTVGRCLNFETYVGDDSNATLSIQKNDIVYTDSDGVAHSLISGGGANVNLRNLSSVGNNDLVDNNCYDFDNPTNIAVGATGTSYTMPVTGLLYIQGDTSSPSGYIGYKLSDGNFNNTRTPLSSGETLAVTLRVKKGQTIIIQYEEANNMKALVYPCFSVVE